MRSMLPVGRSAVNGQFAGTFGDIPPGGMSWPGPLADTPERRWDGRVAQPQAPQVSEPAGRWELRADDHPADNPEVVFADLARHVVKDHRLKPESVD